MITVFLSVLGTIISEWDDGYKLWDEILSSSEKDRDHLIDIFCRIMNHFGFDGWLFNVENRIDIDKIPTLVDFVRKLTRATKEVRMGSLYLGKLLLSELWDECRIWFARTKDD